MKVSKPIPSNQRGLTLVEVMISMVLGILLIGGIIEIFLNSKQTYRMQDNLSRLQENGRFALDTIVKDLRVTSYHGPNSLSNVQTIVIDALPFTPINGEDIIAVVDSGQPNSWPVDLQASVIPETDVITILRASKCNAKLTATMATKSSPLQIFASNTCNIDEGDAVLITDASRINIFFARAGTTNSLITHNPLSTKFNQRAEVYQYQINSYFIRNGASGRPSLWVYENASQNLVELVEDIEDLQVVLGEDTNGDYAPDHYVTSDSPGTSMKNVTSLRINLLAASNSELADQPLPFQFNGATTTPSDRKVRREFTTVISLRNRLP